MLPFTNYNKPDKIIDKLLRILALNIDPVAISAERWDMKMVTATISVAVLPVRRLMASQIVRFFLDLSNELKIFNCS